MKSTTNNQHQFSSIPRAEIQRSQFNRSCGLKTTFDGGKLIPVFTDEVLPGDTFNLTMTAFGRLGTPLVPILDNLYLDSFFFFVPYRLIWDNWEKMCGAQDDPGDSTDFLVPIIDAGVGGIAFGSLPDYLGVPPLVDLEFTALYTRAYNLIFNTWFRDENLIDSVVVDKDDGPDDKADYSLQRRGKRHDYFTSALPWPQKGPAVTLPLGDTAVMTMDTIAANVILPDSLGAPVFGQTDVSALKAASGIKDTEWVVTQTTNETMGWDDPKLQVDIRGKLGTVDLAGATASTINVIREAFQIQRLYERDARGGSRYTEIVRSHFGVISPDQRLQRPEYLGGGTQSVTSTPVPQTSSTDGTSAQGNLAAYAITTGGNHAFTKSFTEHGLILGMVSLRADLNYQQGLDKKFSRRTRFDFYWPALAHIGEQAILNKEIFADGTAADDNVFGYQERWAEYRYKPSQITSRFRSTHPSPLDIWHLAQDFAVLPVLDESFIEENPPIDRVIAVPSEPHMILDAFFSLKTARPMPTYSVPGLIDHF